MFWNFILPVLVTVLGFMFLGPIGGGIVMILAILFMVYRARVNLYILRANKAYDKADVDGAMRLLEKAYQTNQMSAQQKVYYGYLALRCGKPDKAERLFQSALQSKPDEKTKMQAKSNMALVLWKRKQLPEAIELMEEVFEHYKTTAVYGSLGYFYILSGDIEKALKFNEEAYEFNSDDNVIRDNLGQIYYLKNDFDKAEEIYEELLRRQPEFPVPYYNYALVKLAKGDKEAAILLMRKALTYRFTYIAGVSEDQIRTKLELLETEGEA